MWERWRTSSIICHYFFTCPQQDLFLVWSLQFLSLLNMPKTKLANIERRSNSQRRSTSSLQHGPASVGCSSGWKPGPWLAVSKCPWLPHSSLVTCKEHPSKLKNKYPGRERDSKTYCCTTLFAQWWPVLVCTAFHPYQLLLIYISYYKHWPVKCSIEPLDSRLLYYFIREIKTWLNINHITIHNNINCVF